MTKANRTFATAEYIQDWAEQVANCSEYFLENYPRDDPRVEGLRQVCVTLSIVIFTIFTSPPMASFWGGDTRPPLETLCPPWEF